jgi:hypothetical protein
MNVKEKMAEYGDEAVIKTISKKKSGLMDKLAALM